MLRGIGLLRVAGRSASGPEAEGDFFRSLHSAFESNARNAPLVKQGLLVVLAFVAVSAVSYPLVKRYRAARREKRALEGLIRARQLSKPDVELLEALAKHAGSRPFVLATSLEAFERATERVSDLEVHMGNLEHDVVSRVHGLRSALNFTAQEEQRQLLTTRELTPDLPIEVLGIRTVAKDVSETNFSIVLPETVKIAVGDSVALSVLFANNTRYSANCIALSKSPSGSGIQVVLKHDEHPVRLPQQELVRIAAEGPIYISYPLHPEKASDTRRDTVEGALIDVRLDGLEFRSPRKFTARTPVQVSFSFGDTEFTDLNAVVRNCHVLRDGQCRLIVEFEQIPEDERGRLLEAISQASKVS